MRQPNILTINEIINDYRRVQTCLPVGRYVPARPEPFWGMQAYFRALWLVITGKGAVVLWEEQ